MNKIISFLGADYSVGTTMTAQSTAEILAENRKKVLLILASSNPLMDYFKTGDIINRSIDELRPSLRAENLTKEEVMNICYRTKNLTVLPPVKDLTLIRFFRETDLETIINLVIDNFDFIVIDGGCNIQHPLNISALMCCNKLFVVITQQEKSLNRYRLLKETVLNPLNLNHSIIVNKFTETSPYYSKKNLFQVTGIREIFMIKNCDNSWEAEIQKETLLKYPKYKEGIKSMVRDIEGQEGLLYNFKGRSKKSVLGGKDAFIN